MYTFGKLKRNPFQDSIKKHLFKDSHFCCSLLFFKKSVRSFSTFAVGLSSFSIFIGPLGFLWGAPVRDLFSVVAVITGQDYTLSWRSSGSQPSTPARSFSCRLPPRRLHLIGAGCGQSLIREESPLRAILNQAPEIEVGMLKRQAARRKEKSCFKHIFREF